MSKLKKLTFHNFEVSSFKFQDLLEYVESTTETIVTGLYYNHPKKSLAKGICLIQRDDDVEFVRIRNANKGRISLYLGHNNEDLSKYVDGEIDDEKEQYGSHDNDTDSDVASLDHLSQSEEELRQVRLKKANQKTKENSLNNYDFNMLVESNKEDEGIQDCDPAFSKVDEDS
ncbi:hypothetical protein Tco_0567779 [Tanacetum coccineum]